MLPDPDPEHPPAAGGPSPSPQDAPPPRRSRRVRRAVGLALGALVVLLLAEGAAVAVSGVRAGQALQRVADAAPRLVADVRGQRFAEARPEELAALADSRTAARATNQLPYRLAEHVPWVGDQLRAVRAAATAAALLAEPVPDALPLAEEVLSGEVVSADERIDVTTVRRLVPLVQDLARRADIASAQLQAARGGSLAEPLASRLDPVAEQLAGAVPLLRTAADVAPQLPAMLGDPEPRTYLVAFTNPSEIRTTQGIVGAYAVLRLNAGQISLERTGTDDDLYDARADPAVLGEEFLALHGRKAALVQNLTVGAEAADAGRLTSDLWVDAGGERPDAVVFIDPVGLADLLAGHAPLDLGPFGQVPVERLPDVLLREAYVRFDQNTAGRKLFLATASAAAFQAVLSDGLAESSLRGGALAAREGHLAVWSSHEEEQRAIVAAGLAGDLGEQRPWARIGLTNAAASKLNYWMQPVVELSAPCAATGTARSSLTLTLTNPVPEEIPEYMQDLSAGTAYGRRTALTIVSLHLPVGVGLEQVQVDGAGAPVAVDTERGWQLVRLSVAVPPDAPVQVRWQLTGPAGLLPTSVQPPATVAEPQVRTVSCTPAS
ncbi:DUF4012 domain-containing protein [Kineococcus glutinatus]|uniref:DUF4012 domain-containing protein n=1 Tax=Kineococcus glutinatus TaxID=1070872 RepID=A0ABP9HYW4_9ACTN